MKKLLLITVLALCSTLLLANFSLGLSLGQPSGLTGKYQFSENMAVDAGLAYSFFWGLSGYYINTDLLYIQSDLIDLGERYIPVYAGVGVGYLGVAHLQQFGAYVISARVPLGVYYPFNINGKMNIEAFLEFVPAFNITPITNFNVSASIGARYVF